MTTITEKCYVCGKYDHKTYDCKSTMWGCTHCHEKFDTKTQSINHEKYCNMRPNVNVVKVKYVKECNRYKIFMKDEVAKLREQHPDEDFNKIMFMAWENSREKCNAYMKDIVAKLREQHPHMKFKKLMKMADKKWDC